MSIELHEEVSCKLLILNLSGKLAMEEGTLFTPEIQRAVRANGRVRMLVRMHDFNGWSLGAVWADMQFDLQHFVNIERLALVGDKRWEAGMAVLCKPFTTAKVRYFEESKTDEATAWIHEGIAQAVQPI
jgi:hypothetical protein